MMLFSYLYLLIILSQQSIALKSHQEATILADKVISDIVSWWSTSNVALKDTVHYKSTAVNNNKFMICVSGDCNVGLPQNVLKKWAYLGLFSTDCFDGYGTVLDFGENWVRSTVRWKYRSTSMNEYSDLIGHLVTYFDKNGLITGMHHFYSARYWNAFSAAVKKQVELTNFKKDL